MAQQLIIERILRDRDGVWSQIVSDRGLKTLTLQMMTSSAVSLAIYGAVLGASNGWAQALSSTIKLPLLFLATLAICMPTLYLFNLVFGARLSMMQALTLILTAITVTSALTLAFAPISLFFLVSAHSYAFFKLLNVTILVLTALVGLRFLTQGMSVLNDHQDRLAMARATVLEPAEEPALVGAGVGGDGPSALPAAPPPHPNGLGSPLPPPPVAAGSRSMTLLYIWILLFGFVGTQLGWTLRPFFGSPDEPFELFRDISGTFYADIMSTIGKLLGG
jgi:hypothetical protein